MPSTTTPWLINPNPRPLAHRRLFCFPYAGGAARTYQPWTTALPPQIEVCIVELPGHGRRWAEPPITQLAPLIESLQIAMQPWLDKPFLFFGHSLGALIAFELARSLQNHYNLLPDLFWVSAARAPHLPASNPPLHLLPKADFMAELRRYSGTPEAVLANAELMALLLPMLRADFRLLETYRYQEQGPLSCPITACWGESDTIVSPEEVKAWGIHTNHAFSLEKISGDHFFIHQTPLLQRLMVKLA